MEEENDKNLEEASVKETDKNDEETEDIVEEAEEKTKETEAIVEESNEKSEDVQQMDEGSKEMDNAEDLKEQSIEEGGEKEEIDGVPEETKEVAEIKLEGSNVKISEEKTSDKVDDEKAPEVKGNVIDGVEKTSDKTVENAEEDDDKEGEEEDEGEGEEEDEEEMEEIVEEEEEEEFVIHPFATQSPDGTISPDIFKFIYSYGYDCQRPYNLCALDEETVAWASGSFVTFYNVNTKTTTFRRSSTGGSIGAVAKNPDPNFNHIAIAEGGLPWAEPLILIFEWPAMEMIYILRKGTARSYAKMDYSPSGELLASVGGAPDYNLTVWNWQKHRIMLQASAFSFTVNNVLFSPYIPGQLTTSGASHVKFWKMLPTFTGLKLKGELGRFGKTEICDILGVYPMPDEKVLTGCTWGNILVWEGGLVKLEVRCKNKKTCHDGPITYFLRNNESAEVTTVAMDGYIKSWYWETVDEAVVGGQEGGNFVEMNSVTDFNVPGAQVVNITRKKDSLWFGQDAGGSIWTIDLDIDSPDWMEPVRLTRWHGSSIVGLEVLRGSKEMLVSLGGDGTLGLSEIPVGPMKCLTASIGKATCLLYFPKQLDRTGRLLLIGNSDGNVRLIALFPENFEDKTEIVTDDSCVGVIQILKPHTDAITTMSLNNECSILVTASQDSTLFIYRVTSEDSIPQLTKLCYIDTPKVINHINWSRTNSFEMFMCANDGLLLQVELPHFNEPPSPDAISFHQQFAYSKEHYFKEYSLRYSLPDDPDDMELDSMESDEEQEKKEDEVEEEDEDKNKEEPPEVELVIYREKSNRPLLFSAWDPWNEGALWIIPDGLGCILNYKPRSSLPFMFIPLPDDSWETNICSMHYLEEHDIMMLGKSDGEIFMFCKPVIDDETFQKNLRKREKKAIKDKSGEKPEFIIRADIVDYLRLPMHDCTSGNITRMVFSNDQKYFFTSGADGNIFSYNFDLVPEVKEELSYDVLKEEKLPELKELPEEDAVLSHEELAREKERQRLLEAANLHKQKVRNQLADLTIEFKEILKRNMALPPEQQIDMILDDRIVEEEENILADQMALMRRKLAYPLSASSLRLNKLMKRNIDDIDLFPFQLNSMLNPEFNVKIIRQKKLMPNFFDDIEVVKARLDEAIRKAESHEKEDTGEQEEGISADEGPDAPLLYWLPPAPPPPRALVTALRQYLHRITRHYEQEKEWQAHQAKHVFDHVEKEGAAALAYEEANIGEYHLKCRPGSIQPSTKGAVTLHQTHLQLFVNRQEIFELQHEFNETLLQLRKEKSELVEKFSELDQRLKTIGEALPIDLVKPSPFDPLPTVDKEAEYPELNLELIKSKHGRRSTRLIRHTGFIPVISKPTFILRKEDPTAVFWEMNDINISRITGTPLEEEYKRRHLIHLLIEQDEIIKFMRGKMSHWERRLKEASRERERVLLKAQCLKLHQLQLTQEFEVLDSMQFKEDTLMDLVRGHQMDCKMAMAQVKELEKTMDETRKDIAAGLEQIKVLELQQKRLAGEIPKFTKFLKRVFKKKRKPLKSDSESDESLSESETEESESETSEDSEGELNIEELRMNSNVCPPGCDPQIFEETVELREMKYENENRIKDNEKLIEMAKRSVAVKNKEIKVLTLILEESQGKLQELLDTKQKLLNEIECTVVVSVQQCALEALQGVMEGNHACEGAGTVLFPAPYIAKLKARVLELQREEREQRRRYFLNLNHVRRMNVDCSHMQGKIEKLRTKYQEILTCKLALDKTKKGVKDPNLLTRAGEILDSVLMEMTQAFKVAASSGFTEDMNDQLADWKTQEVELEREYCELLQKHTEKLKLAAALQAELFTKHPSRHLQEMPGGRSEEEYRQDIVRLKRIRHEQQQQIDSLKEEIYNLRVKHPCTEPGLRPPPLPGDTEPPSEIVTPPCQPSKIRTIAASLVKCLADSGLDLLQDISYSRCLLEELSTLLPALSSGKTGVQTATAKILESVCENVKQEEKTLKMEQCKRSVSDLLQQFVRENIILEEMRHVTSVVTRLITNASALDDEDKDRDVSDILKDAIVGLLEAGVGPKNFKVMDAIVVNLITRYPNINVDKVDEDMLLDAVMEQGIVYNKFHVKDMIRAIIECIKREHEDYDDESVEVRRVFTEMNIFKLPYCKERKKPCKLPFKPKVRERFETKSAPVVLPKIKSATTISTAAKSSSSRCSFSQQSSIEETPESKGTLLSEDSALHRCYKLRKPTSSLRAVTSKHSRLSEKSGSSSGSKKSSFESDGKDDEVKLSVSLGEISRESGSGHVSKRTSLKSESQLAGSGKSSLNIDSETDSDSKSKSEEDL